MIIFTLILLGISMAMGIYSIKYPKKVFGFQVFWNLRRDANPIEMECAIDFIRIKAIIVVIINIILLLAILTQF